MIKKILSRFIPSKSVNIISPIANNDYTLLAIGKLLSNQQYLIDSKEINDYEFKIFSQFGDDGIIQFLIKNIDIENEVFIEFGVGNYMESNTRFLMMNNNWSGFIMHGLLEALSSLKQQDWFWKYDLSYKQFKFYRT